MATTSEHEPAVTGGNVRLPDEDTPSRPRLPQALGERIDIKPVVESLRPLIVASLPRIEEDRRLPQELVDAMHDAGIMYTNLPREFGGLELHPLDYLDLIFELSRISGSVGWIAVIQNGAAPLLKPELMRELIDRADGRWLISGSHGRTGRADKVEGGYRFSGQWVFASGIPWATWIVAYADVYDEDGNQVMDPFTGGPMRIDAVVPRSDITYLDGWNSLGLRGTGSGMFSLTDHFVESHMTAGDAADDTYLDRALFRQIWIIDMAGIMLGIAQSALDMFATMYQTDRREGFGQGGEQLLPAEYAHADVTLRAAREYVWNLTERAFDVVENGNEREQYESILAMAQADIYVAGVCKDIVSSIFELAGSAAVRTGGLERIFRDIHTATQHTAYLQRAYVPIGQFRLTENSPDGPSIGRHEWFPPPPAPARTWSVDPLHSTVGFRVKHHAVGTFRARFTDFDLRWYEGQNRFKGSVKTESLVTFAALREHLLGEGYFDAANHPEIAFASTSVTIDDDTVTIEGDLTMCGVTKPVTATGTKTGTSKVAAFATGFPDQEHVGFDLEMIIDRRDFGIDYNNELLSGQLNLGWDVTLEFSLELSKAID